MRTNTKKALAEDNYEEYNEYASNCLEINMVPMDIYSWLAEQLAIKEEHEIDMLRDDALEESLHV